MPIGKNGLPSINNRVPFSILAVEAYKIMSDAKSRNPNDTSEIKNLIMLSSLE
jgi:hypothetical protein